MLHLYETKKAKRVAVVAALLTFATAGVAVARQDGQFPGLPPANGSSASGTANSITVSGQGLQPIFQRAAQYQQAASVRGNIGPTAVRVSYSAANQAFGDLLRTIGTPTPTNGISSPSDRALNVSSDQAANDVRALKMAARQAKSTDDETRLNKAASLYATGAKEFLTAQLREALLDADVAAPVPIVVRGNAQEAAEAARQAQSKPAPVAPAPAPKQPAPAPAPNPAPAPVPAPNPAPVPNPNPAPVPDPNSPQPNPVPDPNNPPQPLPAPNPQAPQNPPG